MAISLKSVTINKATSATVAVTTSESPSATSSGDLVVVIHFNDFYNLSNMPTPTATGSPTLTAVTNGTADAGANQAHVKSYTYTANTGGAQTISVTETGTADEEKALVAYVLGDADTGSPIDIAGNNTAAVDTDPWDLTSITTTLTDDYLIAHAGVGPLGLSTMVVPGAMTERYNSAAAMPHAAGATEQLSVSGATGTKSFNPDPGRAWAGVLIAIKTASGAPPPTTTPTFLRPTQAGWARP